MFGGDRLLHSVVGKAKCPTWVKEGLAPRVDVNALVWIEHRGLDVWVLAD